MPFRRRAEPLKQNSMENFWSKVQPEPTSGCWLWTAATDSKGYGQFRDEGKLYRAPRLSYEKTLGPIPRGKQVLHRCDNPPV